MVQWAGFGAFVAKYSDPTSWQEHLPTFVARTVQPILHQASCSNETIQNAPKHYETQQYVSLGSNGVGQVHTWRKIPKRLPGTNLCINCTSSTRFGSNGVDWVRSLRKIPKRLRGKNFCINSTSSARFVSSFVLVRKQSKMHPNTMKRTKT